MNLNPDRTRWALVVGSSSGFGEAAARVLAREGLNIFGVHFDLKSTLPRALQVKADVEAKGRKAIFFNKNVADDRNRTEIIGKIQDYIKTSDGGSVALMLHSVAFGNLKPFIAEKKKAGHRCPAEE